MDELEKNELIDELLERMSEMSDEEKKQRGNKNNKILKGVSAYFTAKLKEYEGAHPYNGMIARIDCPHTWHAYYQIRKIIPWFIGVRYGNIDCWNAFYEANPGAEQREIHISVPNPMLEDDKDLATMIGKDLIDILFKYLEPDAFDEEEAAKNRDQTNRGCPLSMRRRI